MSEWEEICKMYGTNNYDEILGRASGVKRRPSLKKMKEFLIAEDMIDEDEMDEDFIYFLYRETRER